jgi:2-dehydropantoate 2-reductase
MSARIAVLGAGANGAAIGADLVEAGHRVSLVEQWPEHVEAMRARGVRIEMPGRTLQVDVEVLHFCDVATLRTRFDVVLMLMKAYDSVWAARLIEPYLAADGLLVGVQNGMTVDGIAGVVGPTRTLGCVIEISSMMFEPGVVERHSGPDRSWFALGAIDDRVRVRVPDVVELLEHSGTVAVVDDIRAAKWMKLVSNATTLVTTAILGLPMREAHALPGMRELMLRAGQEALDAGRLQDFPVLPIFGLDAADVDDEATAVQVLLDTLLEGFVLDSTKTTILQDWIKGRHSEVDDINGEVVSQLQRHGVAAPANGAVVALAHEIESGRLDPGPANLRSLRTLAGL